VASQNDRMKDYVEVPDRIKAFKEKFPEGCLRRKDWHIETVGDHTFIVYTALAYRTPDDPMPGEGTAWEPFPGKTPYTRDSELMNAETSAWGRALAALGFIGKKIASREEVEARQGNGAPKPEQKPLSKESRDKVIKAFADAGIKGIEAYYSAAGLDAVENMTAAHAMKLRELLDKELAEREAATA
jgi:hypothetical protein